MERMDSRQLCPGSDSLFPTELVNPWTGRSACSVCGQEVPYRLAEELWFLESRVRQWESSPDFEALPTLR